MTWSKFQFFFVVPAFRWFRIYQQFKRRSVTTAFFLRRDLAICFRRTFFHSIRNGIDNSFMDFSFCLHTMRDNVVVGDTMFASVMSVASGASSERKNVSDAQEIIHEMLGMIAQCTSWLKLSEKASLCTRQVQAEGSSTTFFSYLILSIKFPLPCVFAIEQIKCSLAEQRRLLLRNVYGFLTSQWWMPLVRTAATAAAARIKLLSIWELVAFLCAFYEATIYRIQIFSIESERCMCATKFPVDIHWQSDGHRKSISIWLIVITVFMLHAARIRIRILLIKFHLFSNWLIDLSLLWAIG